MNITDFGLSAQQIQVIDALSSGATMTSAAVAAGIHRNTIPNWRRNNFVFSHALAHAQYDRALLFRERAQDYVDLAFQTIQDLLTNPATPPSVRLRAALAIVEITSNPPDPAKRVELDIEKIHKSRSAQTITEDQLEPAPKVHNDAQTPPDPDPAPDPQPEPQPDIRVDPCSSVANSHPPVHKVAQIRHTHPKIGRNDPCPCKSGKKYKRCCIDKPTPQPVAAA
jgi:hypothetical protein